MDLGEAPWQELKYLLWFLYKLSPATGVSGLMTPPRGATDDLPLAFGTDHVIANAELTGQQGHGRDARRHENHPESRHFFRSSNARFSVDFAVHPVWLSQRASI